MPVPTVTCGGTDYVGSYDVVCRRMAAAGVGPYDVVAVGTRRMTYLAFHQQYHIDWGLERRRVWAVVRLGLGLRRTGPAPSLPHDGLP